MTVQRVSQIVAERDDFPEPAKVIARHRVWRREDVERWRDAKPRVWAPTDGDREPKAAEARAQVQEQRHLKPERSGQVQVRRARRGPPARTA